MWKAMVDELAKMILYWFANTIWFLKILIHAACFNGCNI